MKKIILIIFLLIYSINSAQAYTVNYIKATSTATSTFAGSINLNTGSKYQIGTTTILYINGNAITVGINNTATGYQGSAIGINNTSINSLSTAIGTFNKANNLLSSAMGYGNTSNDINSVSLGYVNSASGVSSVAIGSSNTANGFQSIAIGYNVITTGGNNVAMGSNFTNNIGSSAMFGNNLGHITLINGNVGIATDTPLFTLDINGDLNFSGNLYKNGVLVQTYSYMQEMFYGILIWFIVVASIVWLIRRIT